MGSGFFSQDNPPPVEQSPAGPGPGNVVVEEPTGVDGATASFFGRGAAPALQAFEEDAKAAADEAAASAAAAAGSATAAAASAGEALNVATGIDAQVDAAEAAKIAAQASATNAATSATNAAGSASAAATSATQAATSATNAGNSATSAATSATNSAASAAGAAASASQAASSANSINAAAETATAKAAEATTSATNAANSATSAANSASTATTKASEASASASAASGSATSAANSASSAGTSATTATTKASEAATSANNAATSAATATTKASEAATSATSASNSATSASGSAATATTKAAEASTSATNAAASASTATTKASEASTSATNAASSALTAGTSATNAANSASSASTSATNAAASATSAANSATAAAGSATSASSAQAAAESARDATLAAFDSFDDRYLGTKTSNPTVDNDGNALVAGALYFNSTAGEMRVWTGSAWTAAYVSGAGVLLIANNLSDLANAATARTNLGLGNVENKSSATIRSELTSGNVTTALGYTPYNATNPSGYISGITSGMVTTALGYTPYNSSNPAGYITGITSGNVTTALGYTPANKAGDTFSGPLTVNNGSHQIVVASDGNIELTRSGGGAYIDLKDSTAEDYDVRLQASGNVLAIGASGGMTLNGSGVLTGITSGMVTTALGYTPYNSSNPAGYISGITSGMVTTALGYTPYNSTNPAGYITSSALTGYALLSGAAFTGNVTTTGNVGIGTTAPSNQLSVAANNTATISLDWTGDNAAKAWFSANHSTGEVRHAAVTNYFPTFYSNNSERMRIDLSGNVGIGTSSPYSRFTIVPSSTPTTVAGANQITVGESTANSAYRLQIGYLNNGASGYNGSIQVYDNGNAQSLILNGAGGNVGIGTSSPGAKLHISGSSTGNSNIRLTNILSPRSWELNPYTTGDSDAKFAIRDVTAAADRIVIDASGNVGIGTSSPGAKLDVIGVAVASTDASTGNSPLVAANINSGSNTTKYTSLLFQGRDTINSGKNVGLVQCGPSDINWVTSYLAFHTRTSDALTERMRIHASGGVSVGTTTDPGAGNLNVSGKIIPDVQSTTSTATLTPNANSDDLVSVSAQAVGLTIAAASGTASDGQKMVIRIKDNGSSQTISWNAAYVSAGATLPTATTAGKWHHIGLIYNSNTSTWMCVAAVVQA